MAIRSTQSLRWGRVLAGICCLLVTSWCNAVTPVTPAGKTASQSAVSETARAKSTEAEDYGKVGYASLTGPIDRLRHRYLDRVVDKARELKLDTLILHIDTDGGEVSHAREMFKKVLEQKRDGPRMIAFVDFRSISAGAMISYAHEAIYISPGASIGDIGVIFISREGEIKYAPEKVETVIRSLLTQAAEVRGWDAALLLKMTARTQKLYHVTLSSGETRYVIEDNLPELLAKHPDLDPENRKQIWVYRGEDRLLTLTGQEAVKLGMATGLAADKDDLYTQLGIESAAVTDLSPRTAELTAWSLATFAPVLAGLALLFVLFELKTPGVGLWALLALACGGAFLLSQYYLDMAENFEIVLLGIGVLLLGIDVILGVGGGALALTGGGLVFFGLLMSFVPNELTFDLSDEAFQKALKDAAVSTFFSVGVLVLGVVVLVAVLPRSRARSRFAVVAEVTGTSAGTLELEPASIVGKHGVTREILRPGGLVEIDGSAHSARAAHGNYIAAGAAVTVTGVEFGDLIVTPLDSGSD